jgi:hypothetical protein
MRKVMGIPQIIDHYRTVLDSRELRLVRASKTACRYVTELRQRVGICRVLSRTVLEKVVEKHGSRRRAFHGALVTVPGGPSVDRGKT